MATEPKEQVGHPLDPLTPDEIELAGDLLTSTSEFTDGARIVKIELDEPSKDAITAHEEHGREIERQAFAVIRDSPERKTYEATVSLEAEEISSVEHIEGAQPSIAIEEFIECEQTVKAHEEWQAALEDRGVVDTERAMVDPWSVGYDFIPEHIDRDRRLAHGLTYVRPSADDGDEGYAKPVTGLHVYVDLDEMSVVEVVDNGPPDEDHPLPPEEMAYREADIDLRDDLKPYDVVQPDGPSFDVSGHRVEWQNWEFRVGWTQREGLVLHNVGYNDDGEFRKILHRASLAEMSVPYGTPDQNDRFKNAMDAGEYNIGRMAKSLEKRCDCLGYMHYFDAVMNTMDGAVNVLPNAICMHEEDYGLLWERSDWRTESAESRRNRRLVVSFIAAVGNYDYGFYWYFYQDGSVQVQVRLTGIDNVSAAPKNKDVKGYSELVAPQLKAPIHQHFFNFRLDFDIDGTENNVYEVENQTVPSGPQGFSPHADPSAETPNPGGNAFYAEERQLESEQEAQRLINPLDGRYWKVTNPTETNRLDNEVGYRIEPHENVKAAQQDDSSVIRRSGFVKNHLWVTPHDENEMFPAGDYPNQAEGPAGLPVWTEADRDLTDEDLVVWYTLGKNHVTRPEDWPVLPVQMANLKLTPDNFFGQSEALDVPPEHVINEGHTVPSRDEFDDETPESRGEAADDD
ncbi:primary-amine oxidase [Haloarcula vallismortis]|uniref:Amine oxidase n=2 Tax=Haloarcula vallismortis TaxID=28442 RepID=M0J7J6_HALVA|nr:primary-amine oxidase [Haloarcula vallismortis]EMA05097.1 tyramine oxidase [Haloarcula vallismortis ATCC 29715]SDX13448.1 primary-amine oxidase [Haloarcula vallismortis]